MSELLIGINELKKDLYQIFLDTYDLVTTSIIGGFAGALVSEGFVFTKIILALALLSTIFVVIGHILRINKNDDRTNSEKLDDIEEQLKK